MHADEHHGAVDEESDGYQADDVKGGVSGRGEPVDGHEDGHERHVDHRRDGAASLEELVAEPPAEDGAGDGGELIGEVSPAHVLQVVSLDVLQVGRSPVQAAVTHHVDEGVGEGDEPERLVVEHVLEEDFLRREHGLALLAVVLRVVVAVFLDGRQPARLRRVAYEQVGYDGYDDGHHAGEPEGAFLPAAEPDETVGGHRAYQGAAHIVRAVPDGHLRAALLDGEPVGHDTPAGRPAHALEPADAELQDEHHGQRGDAQGRAHQHGRARGKQQTQRKELARVAAVGHAAHEELREGVGDRIGRDGHAQGRMLVAHLFELGHGHREVLADQVIARIPDKDSDKHLPAQGLVLSLDLLLGQLGLVGRRS